MKKSYTLISPCFFGMEKMLAREIKDLGFEIIKTEDGRTLAGTVFRSESSQSELRLPLLQVVSSNKYFSVGVQSPTEINAPRGRTLSGRQWFCADRNGV